MEQRPRTHHRARLIVTPILTKGKFVLCNVERTNKRQPTRPLERKKGNGDDEDSDDEEDEEDAEEQGSDSQPSVNIIPERVLIPVSALLLRAMTCMYMCVGDLSSPVIPNASAVELESINALPIMSFEGEGCSVDLLQYYENNATLKYIKRVYEAAPHVPPFAKSRPNKTFTANTPISAGWIESLGVGENMPAEVLDAMYECLVPFDVFKLRSIYRFDTLRALIECQDPILLRMCELSRTDAGWSRIVNRSTYDIALRGWPYPNADSTSTLDRAVARRFRRAVVNAAPPPDDIPPACYIKFSIEDAGEFWTPTCVATCWRNTLEYIRGMEKLPSVSVVHRADDVQVAALEFYYQMPDCQHFFITPDSDVLQRAIGANIVKELTSVCASPKAMWGGHSTRDIGLLQAHPEPREAYMHVRDKMTDFVASTMGTSVILTVSNAERYSLAFYHTVITALRPVAILLIGTLGSWQPHSWGDSFFEAIVSLGKSACIISRDDVIHWDPASIKVIDDDEINDDEIEDGHTVVFTTARKSTPFEMPVMRGNLPSLAFSITQQTFIIIEDPNAYIHIGDAPGCWFTGPAGRIDLYSIKSLPLDAVYVNCVPYNCHISVAAEETTDNVHRAITTVFAMRPRSISINYRRCPLDQLETMDMDYLTHIPMA